MEIGGEFWKADTGAAGSPRLGVDSVLLLSGRTALDLIIRDIRRKRRLRTAYLPCYCCASMIEPFTENGVAIKFYPVSFSDGAFVSDIDPREDCDAVLLMQYFGFSDRSIYEAAGAFRQRGVTVIEDATHSFFTSPSLGGEHADYAFASLRKWTGLSGGALAAGRPSESPLPAPGQTNEAYIGLRENAFALKAAYIARGGDKARFLSLFQEAETLLERDYKNYCVPDAVASLIRNLDCGYIAQKRKRNARVLMDALRENPHVTVPQYDEETDTPLFVPIFVAREARDRLKDFLISNDVYCPIHWPKTQMHPEQGGDVFERELSLVCDQRYGERDMAVAGSLINLFFGVDSHG